MHCVFQQLRGATNNGENHFLFLDYGCKPHTKNSFEVSNSIIVFIFWHRPAIAMDGYSPRLTGWTGKKNLQNPATAMATEI